MKYYMQTHSQTNRTSLAPLWTHSFFWILLLQPLVFFLVIPLLPTFDDWTYLAKPQVGDFDLSLLLPYKNYWRPFDGLLGYIAGRNLALFPTLNHVLILTAHLLNTLLLMGLARRIHLNRLATNIALLVFYFSPAMLGTVLDIDSMNQAYALLWGLLALYIATGHTAHRRIGMASALLLSVLCKENGLCFILIIPLFLHVFCQQSLRQTLRELLFLSAIGIAYLLLRFSLPQDQADMGGVYVEGGLLRRLRNLGMYLAFTWIPVDFVSLLHAPSRNPLLVGLTLALGIPFWVLLGRHQRRCLASKQFWTLQLCAISAASIHLLTIFTVMHAYAGLAFTALAVGYLAHHTPSPRKLKAALALWLLSVLITDAHHALKAYESGMLGHDMARQAISKTKSPARNVRLIIVDDGYPRYSMFCVIPHEAFGWGEAARFATGYQWPSLIDCVEIAEADTAQVASLASEAYAQGYDCVWLTRQGQVDVIEK